MHLVEIICKTTSSDAVRPILPLLFYWKKTDDLFSHSTRLTDWQTDRKTLAIPRVALHCSRTVINSM